MTVAITIEIRDKDRVEYWRGKPVAYKVGHMQTAINASYADALATKSHAASIALETAHRD